MKKELLVRQKGIALYLQVATWLRARINSNEWKFQDRLPSIEELAQELSVAKVTIRQALDILRNEGLIESKQGLGTFVQQLKEHHISGQSTWNALLSRVLGQDHKVRVLASEVQSSCPHLAEYPCDFYPSYRHQARVHSIKGTPYCYNLAYFAEHIYEKNPELFSSVPIVVNMAQYAEIPVAKARQVLTVETADEISSQYLEIPPGSPVVRAQRIAIDASDKALYRANVVYPGLCLRLDLELVL